MTEVVQLFACKRNSHRRHGATSQIIDMVWLHRSPFPAGGGGSFLGVFLLDHGENLPAFAAAGGWGGGGRQHPVISCKGVSCT
jgi:hypothetical protein